MVLNEITRRIEKAGDQAKEAKICSQVDRAYAYIEGGGNQGPPILRASFRPAALRHVAEKITVDDIVQFVTARSAVDPARVTSQDFLRALYQPGEKVVVFTIYESQGQAIWPDCGTGLPTGGKDGVWYLANPVDGRFRKNPRTHTISRRSAESVTSFRFAVLETDEADLNDWLKCLALLPLRIAAIYESGGRSIHALVQVDAATKEEWDQTVRKMKSILITLGADPNALTAVRLSRLPQAQRGGRVQRLLYLNPSPDAVPICMKSPRHHQPTETI
jgi:hypothetical protein